MPVVRQVVFRSVGKRVFRLPQSERTDRGLVRYATQHQYQRSRRQRLQLRSKIGIAGRNLPARGFVFGRQALDRISNAAILQDQAIIRSSDLGHIRKAMPMQAAVKEYARIVSGEGTPAGIGAMHAGGQTNYKQAGSPRTKGSNRRAMVGGVFAFDRIEEPRQTLTAPACRIEILRAHGQLPRDAPQALKG